MPHPSAPAPPRSPGRSRSRRTVLVVTAAVVAALTVVFVLYAARSSTNGSTAASPAAQAGAAAPAKAAGAFTARTLDGAGVDVPGSRPSALFFYSVECGACGPGAQSLAEGVHAEDRVITGHVLRTRATSSGAMRSCLRERPARRSGWCCCRSNRPTPTPRATSRSIAQVNASATSLPALTAITCGRALRWPTSTRNGAKHPTRCRSRF